MICPHCKAQWQLPPENKVQKTTCPFCDGNLYEEFQELCTVEAVMREIVSRFGINILFDSDELISAFALLAPSLKKEIQALLLFEACGGVDCFLDLKGAKQEKIDAVYTDQIRKMTSVITEICSGFLMAAGISIGESVDVNEQPSQTIGWEYVNLENNTIEITACKDRLPANIIFPSYIGEKKVVSIGSTVFGAAKTKGADRLRVESVYVPRGITSIGSSAFDGCKSLKEVSLPEGLLFIGDNAFKNCKTLSNITIPDSVTHIGSGAFCGSNIQSIVLPGGIRSVMEDVFKNCKKLISVTVMEGISSIKRAAFYECKSITNVSLPQSLVSIERDAFYSCGALKNIILPNGIKVIGHQAFNQCSLTIETLPTSLNMIENGSFEGCNFTYLIIPDTVTKIENYAFANCWSLKKITIPKSVVKIETDAFLNIGDEVIIVCYKNSYTHKWAIKHKIDVELIEM